MGWREEGPSQMSHGAGSSQYSRSLGECHLSTLPLQGRALSLGALWPRRMRGMPPHLVLQLASLLIEAGDYRGSDECVGIFVSIPRCGSGWVPSPKSQPIDLAHCEPEAGLGPVWNVNLTKLHTTGRCDPHFKAFRNFLNYKSFSISRPMIMRCI